MKKLVALCLIVGFIWALPRDKDFIDSGGSTNLPHRPLATRQGAVSLIDSSGNGYSAWTNIQSCIAFNPTIGAVEFVSRGFDPTGVLNVAQADAAFSFAVSDQVVYDAALGNARYPTSVASADGHIGFPVLIPGASWGRMGAQHCAGGWWNSFWSDVVDLSGDIGAPRSIGVELPTGNLVFVADVAGTIPYYTMSPDLGTTVASGNLASNCGLYGIDCNGGICYVFWYDNTTLDVFYTSTTDGITWTSTAQWNLTYPSPYTNNVLNFPQMAVTDAGNPILVFDILDNDDLSYPQAGKVYVSTASGATPIQVSNDAYEANFWPTIATGGNWVQVLMHTWTNGYIDSLARHDMFVAGSPDNGATWSSPVNITASEPNRPGLAQLAKRLDATNDNFFYFYGVDMIVDYDPDWVVMWSDSLDAMAWYWGWYPCVGIEEHEVETPPSRLTMNITNPASRSAKISYTLTNAGEISLKVYDRTGSLVRTIETGYKEAGVYNFNLDVSKLANGTYFARLDTSTDDLTRTFVVIH